MYIYVHLLFETITTPILFFLFFDFNILINNDILSLARSVFNKVQRSLTKKNQKTNQKIYQTINGGTKP